VHYSTTDTFRYIRDWSDVSLEATADGHTSAATVSPRYVTGRFGDRGKPSGGTPYAAKQHHSRGVTRRSWRTYLNAQHLAQL